MLRRIYLHGGDDNSGAPSIDIVVVPGEGASIPDSWDNGTGSWLYHMVAAALPRAQIWAYHYNINVTGGTVIQQIFDEGFALLECLTRLPRRNNVLSPILFLGHSSGGLILKKAMCLARERYLEFRDIIDVISGIAFLGTPHIMGYSNLVDNQLDIMLRSQHTILPKSAFSKTDNDALAEISRQFEIVDLQVPITSICETKATKIHDSRFARFRKSRYLVVVPASIAKTSARNERLEEYDANHTDICKLTPGDVPYVMISGLMQVVLKNAPMIIAEQTSTASISGGLDYKSFRSQTTIPGPEDDGIIERIGDIAIISSTKTALAVDSGEATAGSTKGSFEVIPLPASFEPAKKDPVLPCYSMGPYEQNGEFFGRTEVLGMIDQTFFSSQESGMPMDMGSLRSFALCGMGGMGKTQIAVEYMFTRKSRFDAIFWLHADDVNVLAENFAHIASSLGLEPAEGGKDLLISREKVKGWLSDPVRSFDTDIATKDEALWLLIFDNVDNLEVLNDYWPATGRGYVLVTSRDPWAKTSFYTANSGIDLKPFEKEESVQFINTLTHASMTANKEDINALADRLAGLPLAIAQVAGIFRRLRLSYGDLLKLFDQTGHKIYDMEGEKPLSGYTHSVSTVWALDILSKDAATFSLLQVISLLDPDRIPEPVLQSGLRDLQIQGVPKDLVSYFESRKILVQSSLITYNEERGELMVHRLLQEAMTSRMDQNRYIEVFRGVFDLIYSAWPFQTLIKRHNTARWNDCAALFPSVTRLKNAYLDQTFMKHHQVADSFATLLNDAGWYLFERGFPHESRVFFQVTQSVCKRSKNPSSEEVTSQLRLAHGNEGCAAAESNDRAGCLYHAKIWIDLTSGRLSQSGSSVVDFELGTVYNETGVAYALNDMYDAALDCFLQSIRVYREIENFEDIMLGWPEPNLGLIYWIQGDLMNAELVLNEILEIHATAFGVDDTESFKTGKILYAMANVLYSQKRLDESLDYHSRALVQFRTTLGDGHRRTADVCHRLADHYMRLGNLEEADRLIAQALQVFEKNPVYKAELARTTFKKGQLSHLQGDNMRASASFSKAMELRQEVAPEDPRSNEEIEEGDFDSLVPFWSR